MSSSDLASASSEPRPLTYAPKVSRAPFRFSLIAAITSGAVCLFFWMMMGFIVPRFEAIFADFKMEMPGPTRLLLAIGRFSSGGGIILYLLVPVALGVITPILASRYRPTTPAGYERLVKRMMALMFVLICAMMMIVITVILIMLPMITLIDGISSSNGKR